MKIVEINNLKKTYGVTMALNNLNLEMEAGKILGILGPNGSGKSTLLKILANIINQDSGKVLIDGQVPGLNSRKIVSFMPDGDFLMDWMTLKDAIEFYRDFFQDFNGDKAQELLEFLELDSKLDLEVKDLSKGMREKFHLVLTLARDAKLYILDEPIGGVDLLTRDKILESIITNFRPGSSMIITTHLVGDIEGIFDEVAFINRGEIILKDNADDLRSRYKKDIEGVYREVFKER